MTDFPDIPDFLVVAPGSRSPSWTGRKLTDARAGNDNLRPWNLPRNMDDTSYRLLAELRAEKERKKQESLAALKAWKLENRR